MLKAVPFWVWVLVPGLLLSLTTYFMTRNHRITVLVTLLGFSIAWLVAGFHFWEVYLQEHFIGEYNQFGLPGELSRSGWWLLWDSLILWSVPALAFGLVCAGSMYYYLTLDVSKHIEHEEKPQGVSISALGYELEIKQLKQQLNVYKQKLLEFASNSKKMIVDLKKARHLIETLLEERRALREKLDNNDQN